MHPPIGEPFSEEGSPDGFLQATQTMCGSELEATVAVSYRSELELF